MNEVRIDVGRGALVESWHQVSVAVVDQSGAIGAVAGIVDAPVVTRSAVKPFQALPLVEDGAMESLDLTDEELAVCCGSHSGEPRHVEVVRSILDKVGVDEDSLACGPLRPMSDSAARELRKNKLKPGKIHNNCSGKHAGMMALARIHGWDLAGYHHLGHPVQERMLREISRWTGIPADSIATAVDGCGVPTFAVPLVELAGGFAGLLRDAATGKPGAERLVSSMVRYPEMVGGTGRLCTDLPRVTGGRVIAKVGAEGMYCAGVVGEGPGIALKVHDGSWRAAAPALVGVLKSLGLLSEAEADQLEDHMEPVVRNSLGDSVGKVRPVVRLISCLEGKT